VMLAIFARIKPALRKSITFDNDTAFAQHGLLQSMRAMATWSCDAYASWQKGGVENANGRLRRWLPRHIDIDRLSDAEIQDIVITANLTPRKCLGFKTPFQAILKELGKDAQIRFSSTCCASPQNPRSIEEAEAAINRKFSGEFGAGKHPRRGFAQRRGGFVFRTLRRIALRDGLFEPEAFGS